MRPTPFFVRNFEQLDFFSYTKGVSASIIAGRLAILSHYNKNLLYVEEIVKLNDIAKKLGIIGEVQKKYLEKVGA